MTTTRASPWAPVVISAMAAIVIAILGASVTELGPWYQSLQEPAWKPPDWLFGPAWTLIFALTAMSGYLAWRSAPGRPSREWIIGLFALNGSLNIFWSVLFFRLHRPDWAFYEGWALWISIVGLMILVGRFSGKASALLLPYLAWVTFAGYLNLAVVRLNGPF